ncbi:NADH-ubiquinone oxidoreductase chain 5 [Acrasis kona]|uniref:NADH-ubiquinone oxidoreductase chain 5 n=1 Tax=Acrasis kona TaxID=1008807 RepID=A0AAW2YN34_9EUKA
MIHFLFVTLPVLVILVLIPSFIYFYAIPLYKLSKTNPRPYTLWKKVRSLPLGNTILGTTLMHYLILFSSPYSASISPVIDSMSVNSVQVSMNERFSVRNPFSSIHLAAIINLAEFAIGLNISNQMHGVGKFIPTDLKVDFVKKARGRVSCTSVADVPTGPDNSNDKKATYQTEAEVKDSNNEVVAKVAVTWSLLFN